MKQGRRPAFFLFLLAILALGVGTVATGVEAAAKKKSSAKGKSSKSAKAVPDSMQVLVRIGSETITRGDVQRRIDSLPEQFRANYSTPEGRQQLLDRMVEERVWMAMAVKDGVPKRPQVQQQLDQQRRDLIIRTYVTEVMAENNAPSDSEIQAYYDAHASEYKTPATVTIRHIQTKNEKDAKKVRDWLRGGKQSWDALAKKSSTDTLTRNNGGLLGAVTREGAFREIGSQPALAESAFALPAGGIGGPIKTDRGWHVIKVEEIKPETIRPLDQVKPLITRQLSGQRSQEFYRTKLNDARKSLGVKPDSAAIKSFVSQKKNARDLFNEAQALGPPEARIKAYQSLLDQYPQSEVSPQAQFMIGFINSEELKNYDEAEKAFRTLLQRYPKAELAASAQWMIDHMRTEDAPAFVDLGADSTAHGANNKARGKSTKKP